MRPGGRAPGNEQRKQQQQQHASIALTTLQVTFVLRMREIDEQLARIRGALEFERDDEETIELLLLH